MESCETCPGAKACASKNIQPLLDHAFRLHQRGMDKMEILFAVDDDLEALVEKYTAGISRTCWRKAAILSMARILSEAENAAETSGKGLETLFKSRIAQAVEAFQNFPFAVEDLPGVAATLYGLVDERVAHGALAERMSQRTFRKICTDVAHGR